MKKIYFSTIVGILFTAIAGTLSHFIYEWSNQNFFIGFFVPTNESTWEHMKMVFFPMLLYILWNNSKEKKLSSTISCSNAAALLIGTFSIPVLFYTYTGILGTNYLPLDIAVFYLSILFAYVFRYHFIKKRISTIHCRWLNATVLVLLLCFIIFTLNPPSIGLFQIPH